MNALSVFQPKKGKAPPPLPQKPLVQVWEYLGDGQWGLMGQAFPPAQSDPFFVLLARICPWWPG